MNFCDEIYHHYYVRMNRISIAINIELTTNMSVYCIKPFYQWHIASADPPRIMFC